MIDTGMFFQPGFDKPRSGLPTRATSGFKVVAYENRVQHHTLRCEFSPDAIVNRRNSFGAHEPFANTLLIRHYNHVRGPVPEHRQSTPRQGQPFEVAPFSYVVTDNLAVDDPVSVKKETPLATSPLGDEPSNDSVASGVVTAGVRRVRTQHAQKSRE
jgi:hypothetical protein